MRALDLNFYSRLASIATRQGAVSELARGLGAEILIVFDKDEEIGSFLPSLSFPQTLSEDKAWAAFLKTCEREGSAEASLARPQNDGICKAVGQLMEPGLIWVLMGESIKPRTYSKDVKVIASCFATILKAERFAKKQEHQNAVLLKQAQNLRLYADALVKSRSEISLALASSKKAKIAADEANAMKSAFLANMSHEIRTPLNAVLGYSKLLQRNHSSPDEKAYLMKVIDRNGAALTGLIDDILDLAKVEAGRLAVEKVIFSLYELLEDVRLLFFDKATQKGLILSMEIDPAVPDIICSDPRRLRQILLNLVGNAVKFTCTGSVSIVVSAVARNPDHHEVEVRVKDTGPGISDQQKKRMFQPFMQADNSITRKFGGTGLGLALSQKLSKALHGKIRIEESEPGFGSTFSLVFEVEKADETSRAGVTGKRCVVAALKEADVENVIETPSLESIKILLVDDSKDNLFLARHVLEGSGALVETACDGVEAISKATSSNYDIVLMDIQMPRMDGFEAIRMLNLSDYDVPVVALTAHVMEEDRIRIFNAGFVGCLAKPLKFPEFFHTIKSCVQH